MSLQDQFVILNKFILLKFGILFTKNKTRYNVNKKLLIIKLTIRLKVNF